MRDPASWGDPGNGGIARTDNSTSGTFSQEYCSVAPCTIGGNLKKRAGHWPCRVEVADGQVSLFMSLAGRVIDAAPAASVQIITPNWLGRLGTGTILKINGKLWVVDFGRVYQQEQIRDGNSGLLRSMFSTGAPAKSARRARELNRDFTAALLGAGAMDQSNTL